MSPLGTGAIAGIAVGAVAIIVFSALIAVMTVRRRRNIENAHEDEDIPPKTVDTETSHDDDATTTVFPKAELDASTPKRHEAASEYYKPGLVGSEYSSQAALVHESDSKERVIFEMEGDTPKRQEADSRQMSEKEVIRHREERINGTDISPITPVSSDRSPTSTLATSTLPSTLGGRTRNLVTPGEVIELNPVENRTMQLVSPLDGSDGSRTMNFNFNFNTMSPLSPINDPESATRKRFSYEDP